MMNKGQQPLAGRIGGEAAHYLKEKILVFNFLQLTDS